MGVFIKGMEMPKNCTGCPICCGLPYQHRDEKGRRPDCPLVELPPHGRLGDLDKLNIHDISPVDGFCVMGVTEEDIELADTVIEAEGDKKQDGESDN